jgi:hypothetical protein
MTAEGFTTEWPEESGWYEVIFNPGDKPMRVYLHVSTAISEITRRPIISWGWDESDDPESIAVPALDYDLIQFRKDA